MPLPLFRITSQVCGYHVYKDVWNSAEDIGQELICKREPGNQSDTHAVAVTKADIIVGHVPRIISPICSIFIRRGGTIKCLITDVRQYSYDLPQGGLEVPCVYTFEAGNDNESTKTQKALRNGGYKLFSVPRQENERSLGASDTKLIKMEDPLEVIEDVPQPQDIEMPKFMDTERIIMGQKLTDEDINYAQKILGAQFPKLNGLRLTLYQDKPQSEQAKDNWIQVIHCRQRDHWILATTIACDDGTVLIYDSVYCNVDEPTKKVIYNVFPPNTKVKMSCKTQRQCGGSDCGVFVLAFATSLAFGIDPGTEVYEQDRMRAHLVKCFRANKFSQFPCHLD